MEGGIPDPSSLDDEGDDDIVCAGLKILASKEMLILG
jgi:hypothetical protein